MSSFIPVTLKIIFMPSASIFTVLIFVSDIWTFITEGVLDFPTYIFHENFRLNIPTIDLPPKPIPPPPPPPSLLPSH